MSCYDGKTYWCAKSLTPEENDKLCTELDVIFPSRLSRGNPPHVSFWGKVAKVTYGLFVELPGELVAMVWERSKFPLLVIACLAGLVGGIALTVAFWPVVVPAALFVFILYRTKWFSKPTGK